MLLAHSLRKQLKLVTWHVVEEVYCPQEVSQAHVSNIFA
jgi:hypothetical protein